MDCQLSWILLCFVLCSSSVTTRSFENYEYQDFRYDQSLYQRSTTQQELQKDIDISMPNVHPTKHDSYFCTSMKTTPDTYIVGYKPHAEMHTAHHMLLFGCESLPTQEKSWNCGDMGVGVCGRNSGEKIMYAWGRNAPVLKLPEDVAFRVGDRNSQYLVLQVHYGVVDQFKKNPRLNDNSGVVLQTTNKRKRYLAAIDLLANGYGKIPARSPVSNLDLSCLYQNRAVIHPFAFRVHAHSLGRVVTAYRVRNGKWKLIGKGDPQRPQAFYDIPDKSIDIRAGDKLAARCTYNSTMRDRPTFIGSTMKDEMCNFYIMFYYDPETTDSSPANDCGAAYIRPNEFPSDSIVPLPGSGEKMVMKRDEDHCTQCKRSKDALEVKRNWPMGGVRTGQLSDHVGPVNVIGQITGVSLATNGDVVIFHRASRAWKADTFDADDKLTVNYQNAIPEDTVAWLDSATGLVKKTWGAGKFYLPHGLTVDHEDNLWLTDVGSHQVFKYSKDGSNSLTLGERFLPGKSPQDLQHFCKPTGVALDSEGNFFVSDGYCNKRILKFSPTGELIYTITKRDLPPGVKGPNNLLVPHSVSTDKQHNKLYVADRENGRVLVFDISNRNRAVLHDIIDEFGKRVFAAHFSPLDGGLIHVVNGDEFDGDASKIKGFTYSIPARKITQSWAPNEGFTMPHDVASDGEGHVYVAEVKPQGGRIWKFV